MKIFCIGLSRTGTTSLSEALTLLGYKVLHYPDTEDVIEKTLYGRFDWEVLDQYDAFADAPVSAFYRELDSQVPGSKFILTVRDDLDSWLESCRRKIKTPRDRYSNLTKGLMFNTVVRTALYTRPYYSHDHFVSAYFRHIEDVTRYFAARRADLLITSMSEGWTPLCHFLDKSVPNKNFPSLRR
jgi:hypothetical protein